MFVLPFFNRVSSWFGPRNISVPGASKNHKGIDFAAPAGTPVFAAKKGVVTVKGEKDGYGNVVYISHADGTETRYGHLSEFTDIAAGMEIEAGTQIGCVGSTGISSGPHLHFEMRDSKGNAVDPSFILNETRPSGGVYGTGKNAPSNWGSFTPPLSDWDNIRAKLQEESEKEKNTISFAYRSIKDQESSPSLFSFANSFSSGSFFSGLLKSLVGRNPLLSGLLNMAGVETEPPAVSLTLSKKDMKESGFTDDEINKIASLSADKNKNALTGALAAAGTVVSSDDLRNIGIDEMKIQQFDMIAARQQNRSA